MGRKKIRNYLGKDYYTQLFNAYFITHHDEVIQYLVDNTTFTSFEELKLAEHNMYYGFDIGWCNYYPIISEMSREWKLDNYKSDKLYGVRYAWDCQSTKLQRIQARKALIDLELDNVFGIDVMLD